MLLAVTGAGRRAWEAQDSSVPSEYRRLLWMIDVLGPVRAVRSLVQKHSATLVSQWLAELEELRFVESREPSADDTLPLHPNEPLLQAGREAADTLARQGAYLALANPARAPIPKAPTDTTVLIVEDDPDQRAMADLRVSMGGYRVRMASCVGELLEALENDGPLDLLLLDGMLPDGNGFDVLAKLRRHPSFRALPIVMLTAQASEAEIGRGLALGADGYVVKPYSKDLLLRVLRGVLQGTPAAA